MATVSLDYDSNGDVELILEVKTAADQLAPQDGSSSTEPQMLCNYVVGCTKVNVKEVRLRVSSNKLLSSSCHFQAMFEGSRFQEAKELKEHGLAAIELSDLEDDVTAMMISVGLLYSSDVQMPTDIDLQTLHNLATLVDKYYCHALVASQAISWFDRLEASQGLPDTFDETLLMWLWIAWVFGIRDRFKELSRVAQQCASNPIDLADEKILLPSRVLKAINDQRETGFQIIEEKFAAFEKRLIEDVKLGETKNELGYDMLKSMVLGHALFLSREFELGEYAALDHAGSSIRMVSDRIGSAQYPHKVSVVPPYGQSRVILQDGVWDLKRTLEEAVKDLNMDMWGVEYADVEPRYSHQQRKDEA